MSTPASDPTGRPASSDPLLQPLQIRHLRLRNRIMSTSHACGLEEGGMPTERYQAYHEEKARGGLALTMFGGSSNVAVDSPSVFRQLNVGVDAVIPHLQRFSERIHAQGAALMVQITHLGRRGEPYAGEWLPTIGPSPIRETLHRSFPKAMDEHDIARVVKAFGDAAVRCQQGGLDGIETLSSAHLIGQFLSPATNQRSDRFGGSLDNRCRFGLLVHQEIRRRVGEDFLVGMRFVVDEGYPGGMGFEDCVAAALVFQREGGIDFFNAIYGRSDTELGLVRDNMPGMGYPIAPWVKPVGDFRREVKLPVFHAARIADIASARHAIREGLLDMAGMTRAHIADPHLVAKLASAREAEIRPCVGATHCQSPLRPHCLHNAVSGRETRLPHRVPRAQKARDVVVIGGGPAGLEAARVAAERGHRVQLFEAAGELGGQLRIAATSWRRDLTGIIDWRVSELARLGVRVHLNRYLSADEVAAEAPDLVIVATGGVPDIDWIDGAEHLTSAWDLLTRAAPAHGEVVIWDGTGRHPAPLCAELAADAGCRVELYCIDGFLAAELTYSERNNFKQRCYAKAITTHFDRRLLRVQRDGNKLAATFLNDVSLTEATVLADMIVVEHGTLPADALYHELRARSVNDGVTDVDALVALQPQPRRQHGAFELHRIGDAVASRNVHAAVLDAFRLCVVA
jgi:2,4-dienoyl-CoA reductase-like NADH-dependent reductase (Old Yellow Enzyme family)